MVKCFSQTVLSRLWGILFLSSVYKFADSPEPQAAVLPCMAAADSTSMLDTNTDNDQSSQVSLSSMIGLASSIPQV
jgi:hypothetical protein